MHPVRRDSRVAEPSHKLLERYPVKVGKRVDTSASHFPVTVDRHTFRSLKVTGGVSWLRN